MKNQEKIDALRSALERALYALKIRNIGKPYACLDEVFAEGEHALEKTKLKFGCHCDLEDGQEPDDCVLNVGSRFDCTYAENIKCPEDCEYWRES